MSDALAKALRDTLVSPNESDRNLEPANVVDGLFAIARALQDCATQLKYLGNGDASTTMGAIEGASAHIGEKADRIAAALEDVASSIHGLDFSS